jgi:hypothetical protein
MVDNEYLMCCTGRCWYIIGVHPQYLVGDIITPELLTDYRGRLRTGNDYEV